MFQAGGTSVMYTRMPKTSEIIKKDHPIARPDAYSVTPFCFLFYQLIICSDSYFFISAMRCAGVFLLSSASVVHTET
jgi:hypothetical protein